MSLSHTPARPAPGGEPTMPRFAAELERLGLAEFLASFPGDSVDCHRWAHAAETLDGVLRDLVELLLLGRPVAIELLPVPVRDAVPTLIDHGVAVRQGSDVQLVDVSLLRVQATWLFAEPPSPFLPRHYFGADSINLARRAVYRPLARVLDLCAGPGFQGLVAAQRCERVTMVELLPEAAAAARLNAEMNGLSDRVEVLVGDVYEPLPDHVSYDHIVANIPFLPTFSAQEPTGARAGGADGFAVGRRVLDGLPRYLEPGGTAHLTALLLHADGRLLLEEELRSWARSAECGLTVTLTDRMPVDAESALVQTTTSQFQETEGHADPDTLHAEVTAMYARDGATGARLAYLRIDHGASGIRILDPTP
ncbi:methyltransferase [Nocardia sp. NPDC088792]|uniref:methyltransferase n=1 Tax=Nocardia sp. NPDC088792 TaxID=3364332 RepID=UPI0038187BD2